MYSDPCYFFYGTLIDSDLREAVLGEYASLGGISPDRLTGWRAVAVRGRTYPVIVPAPGLSVEGVVMRIAADHRCQVHDRLMAFEGHEYEIGNVTLDSGGAAAVFVASPACVPTNRPWSFSQWERRHKRHSLARIARGRLV